VEGQDEGLAVMLALATIRECGVGWWGGCSTASDPFVLMSSGEPETKPAHQQGEYSS
jgi:hypothetical protein